MRITESQLRSIVRRIVRENVSSMSSMSLVSIDDVKSLLDNELVDALYAEVARSNEESNRYDGYSPPNPENILDLIPGALADQMEINPEERENFLLDLQNWISANKAAILKLIDDDLKLIASDYPTNEPSSDTERIFGSEAAYWRYRNG